MSIIAFEIATVRLLNPFSIATLFKPLSALPYALRYVFWVGILLIGFFLIPSKAYAACSSTGVTSQTYNYTAANLNQPATMTFTGSWSCSYEASTTPTISNNICAKAVFSSNLTNGSSTLPYTVNNLSIGGLTQITMANNTWYGKMGTQAANGVINYSITITIPAQANGLITYPSGKYNGTLQLYMDMQGNALPCEGDSGGGWDSDNKALNFTVIMPVICQLNAVNNIDFGKISDIGTTATDYLANGAVFTTCNANTPYTIYLSDGDNRVTGGNRRMANGSNYLSYQLYQDSNYSTVWDTTGGTSVINGSGGKTLVGIGTAQNTPVYGRIAKGTALPPPNDYSDTVIVTTTY